MLASHILGLTPKHSQPQQDCILTPKPCVALSFQVDTHRIIYCSIVAYSKYGKKVNAPLKREWLNKLWATTLGAIYS